jgi:hypothetical protein
MSSVPVQTIQQPATQAIGLERDRKSFFPIAKRALDVIGAGLGPFSRISAWGVAASCSAA